MTRGALWAHGDFKKLWLGQAISNVGDKISRIAVPTIAILTLHGGALQVGILGALRFLPFLVLSPFAGVWVDRKSRRSVMIAADAGRLLTLLTVPVIAALGRLTMAQLYVVAGVVGVLTVFFEVAYQSYLPALVGRENTMEGNEKLQISRSLADVGGAAAAGGLIQALGSATAVFFDALTFLASLASLLFVRNREAAPERGTDDRSGVFTEMRDGLRVLLGDLRLRTLLVTSTTVNLGVSAANALVLVYAYEKGKLSAGQVGIAFALGSVGMILGAVFAGRIADRLSVGGSVMLAILVSGGSYALLPLAGPGVALPALIISQFVIGVADSVFDIQVLSLVQTVTPDHLMGRVGGTAMSSVFGANTLGAMLGGLAGAAVGVRPALAGAGVVIAAAAGLLAASPVPRLRTGAPQPEPADVSQR